MAAEHAVHAEHAPQSFWTKYIFSQDHKIIALQYFTVALLVGAWGMVLSWLIRIQLAFPESGLVSQQAYYQAITQHGLIMIVYLLTAILLGGFGNYLIPLMIGARDMAFPFVNMLSFWVYLLSVLLLVASFLVPGGASGGGWTLYPPQVLTSGTPGSGWGINLLLLSLAVFVVAGTMGGLNYVTTVLQLRTRGMTLMRMPLTVWGIFVAAVLALFAFPPLFVGGVLLLFDNLLGTSFFMPAIVEFGRRLPYEGGNPLLWQHLFWFFGHPEVYIVILPAMGIVSDVLANHARKPIFGYRAMVFSILAIAVISFLVWAHHMFVSGMNPFLGFYFAVATLIIAIPSAVKTYNWLLTLWGGNIRLTTPMLFALGFLSTFVIGGLTGLFLGNVSVDMPLHDTYFVVGHFHLVMGVATIMAIFAGIYQWFPKATGRMLSERLGKVHFWLTFLGTYALYVPMFYMGVNGVPRRYYSLEGLTFVDVPLSGLNLFMTLAAFVAGFAQLVFAFNLVWSLVRGRRAEANPWEATTLEWQTPTTPPPHGNWGPALPAVYRWAYDYSLPGAPRDFLPQTMPPVPAGAEEPEAARDTASSQEGV